MDEMKLITNNENKYPKNKRNATETKLKDAKEQQQQNGLGLDFNTRLHSKAGVSNTSKCSSHIGLRWRPLLCLFLFHYSSPISFTTIFW